MQIAITRSGPNQHLLYIYDPAGNHVGHWFLRTKEFAKLCQAFPDNISWDRLNNYRKIVKFDDPEDRVRKVLELKE